jgi:hypothetical protein
MGTLQRVLWHVNRSQLKWAVKAGATTWHLREKMERRRLAQGLDPSAEERARAAELRQQGFSVVTQQVDQALLGEMGAEGKKRLDDIDSRDGQQTQARKAFWVRLLDAEMHDGRLPADNIFVRFAVQPSVLRILSCAFGEIPWLDYVLLSASRYDGDELKFSQNWHRDHDDVKVIKLFAYLTDVNEDGDGPFTFLPRGATDRFGYPVMTSHFPDARVFGKVSRDDVRVMKGPRLSTFLVETTSCLHMGSRMAPGHVRLLYTATFQSFPRIYPGGSRRPFIATAQTTPLERLVMGL